MREILLRSCPIMLWVIAALEGLFVILALRGWKGSRKPLFLLTALVAFGLFYDSNENTVRTDAVRSNGKAKIVHADPSRNYETAMPIFTVRSCRLRSCYACEIAPRSRNRSSVCFWRRYSARVFDS